MQLLFIFSVFFCEKNPWKMWIFVLEAVFVTLWERCKHYIFNSNSKGVMNLFIDWRRLTFRVCVKFVLWVLWLFFRLLLGFVSFCVCFMWVFLLFFFWKYLLSLKDNCYLRTYMNSDEIANSYSSERVVIKVQGTGSGRSCLQVFIRQ